MSDDQKLSQDEINALLNNVNDDTDKKEEINEYLSSIEVDTMGEIGNISFGTAATVLSELLRQKVEITTPKLTVVEYESLSEHFPHPHVAVTVNYTQGFQGSNILVLNLRDAGVIADLMMGGEGKNPKEVIGDMEMSAVQEAMNQMMGSASTSMSSMFNKTIDISPPIADMLDFNNKSSGNSLQFDDVMLMVMFRLKIGDLIDSNIMHLLPIEFAKTMVDELMNPGENSSANEPSFADGESETNEPASAASELNELGANHETTEPMSDRSQPERQHLGNGSTASRDIQSAVFSDFEDNDELRTQTQNLNMLYDIPLQVTVELGRATRSVKDILRLTPGSVIELNKLAGEPVDIFVNNKMIARGEVVVIDENFGVRVTEIASQKDRLKRLQ
ncbi:MAG TPA: flagellar motor switch phosphatase FliY [Bacillales bacterium]|nr:flagellar motor switch phosphatase FliY [Bacillales bacterium]